MNSCNAMIIHDNWKIDSLVFFFLKKCYWFNRSFRNNQFEGVRPKVRYIFLCLPTANDLYYFPHTKKNVNILTIISLKMSGVHDHEKGVMPPAPSFIIFFSTSKCCPTLSLISAVIPPQGNIKIRTLRLNVTAIFNHLYYFYLYFKYLFFLPVIRSLNMNLFLHDFIFFVISKLTYNKTSRVRSRK